MWHSGHLLLLCVSQSSPSLLLALAMMSARDAIAGSAAQITAEYRAKFRTLYLALKSANNQELRSRVLSGEFLPEHLASLSSVELAAPKESQLRQSMLEKSNKMTVIDSETAASFSTAANQSVVRRELEKREVASFSGFFCFKQFCPHQLHAMALKQQQDICGP
jgi:hypothetical protein